MAASIGALSVSTSDSMRRYPRSRAARAAARSSSSTYPRPRRAGTTPMCAMVPRSPSNAPAATYPARVPSGSYAEQPGGLVARLEELDHLPPPAGRAAGLEVEEIVAVERSADRRRHRGGVGVSADRGHRSELQASRLGESATVIGPDESLLLLKEDEARRLEKLAPILDVAVDLRVESSLDERRHPACQLRGRVDHLDRGEPVVAARPGRAIGRPACPRGSAARSRTAR